MPTRLLRDEILTSRKLHSASWGAECLYYRLLIKSDDWGRYWADPTIVRSNCFPTEKATTKQVAAWLDELDRRGAIHYYVDAGERYIAFDRWPQRTDKRIASKFPAPSGHFPEIPGVDEEIPGSHPELPGDSVPDVDVDVDVDVITPMSKGSENDPEGFDEFWEVYPRKAGKRKAAVKYGAARKRASAEAILSGARAYAVEVQGRERDKIKMPEGWLEGDRWLDSFETARAPEPEREYFVAREVDEEAVAGFAAAAAAEPPSWSKRKDLA